VHLHDLRQSQAHHHVALFQVYVAEEAAKPAREFLERRLRFIPASNDSGGKEKDTQQARMGADVLGNPPTYGLYE
jgi:hypothetical protein